MLALFLFLATALRADAMDVTPVEKVIQMIRDLFVQAEEKAEEIRAKEELLGTRRSS